MPSGLKVAFQQFKTVHLLAAESKLE